MSYIIFNVRGVVGAGIMGEGEGKLQLFFGYSFILGILYFFDYVLYQFTSTNSYRFV